MVLQLLRKIKENTLLVIIFIFSFLTIFKLNNENFTIMEWYNVGFLSDWKIIFIRHLDVAHLPLFDCLILFQNKFLKDPKLLRYLSVVLSIGTLTVLYNFLKEIFDNKTALVGILFLSFNPLFFYYSTQIEPYSLFSFLASADLFLFYRCMLNNENKLFLLFCFVTFLLLSCHYIGLIVLVVQLFYVYLTLFVNKDSYYGKRHSKLLLKFLVFSLLMIIITLFVLFITIWKNPIEHYFITYSDSQTCYVPARHLLSYIVYFLRIFMGLPSFSAVLLLPLTVYLSYAFSKIKIYNKHFFYLSLLIFLSTILAEFTFVLIFIINNSLYLNVRHFMYLEPLFVTVVAFSLTLVSIKRKLFQLLRLFLILLLFSLNIAYTLEIVLIKQTPDYQRITDYLKSNLKESDIISFPICWLHQPFYFYLTSGRENKTDVLNNTVEIKANERYLRIYNIRQLSRDTIENNFVTYTKQGANRLWYIELKERIFGFPHSNEDYSDSLLKILFNKYETAGTVYFPFVKLYLFNLK